MIAALLLAALGAAQPPKPPSPTPEERARQAVSRILKRYPRVVWQEDKQQTGDLNNDRRPDTAILGIDGDNVVIAVLYGPVTAATVPVLLRFHPPKKDPPNPEDVCGEAKELNIGLEPPGVKPSELACAGTIPMTPVCKKTLATERRLQTVRDHGGKGIRLSGGKCLPLHIYFDLGRPGWWRN